MNVVAIIQARMGSTRLPGKTMLKILGRPIIEYVITQVQKADRVSAAWVATTTNPEDAVIAKWAQDHGVHFYRGSSQDVLDRYCQAARLANANTVVRITADCPLTDPNVIDHVIEEYSAGNFDYCSNVHPPSFPDGIVIEVFSSAALERAWREATLLSEREHVTPYLWKNPQIFKHKNVTHTPNWSDHRWTLDTPEDFVFIQKVIEACDEHKLELTMGNVMSLLDKYPEWIPINSQYKRNEGYVKSLAEDMQSQA